MIAKRRTTCLALIFALVLTVTGCARNPETDELEIDYEKVAEISGKTAQYMSFEGLKYLHGAAPGQANFAYGDISAVVIMMQGYVDGYIELGEVTDFAYQAFQRVKERVPEADTAMTNLIAGYVALLSGMLDLAIAAVPENATLILVAIANGLNSGLTDYNAWVSTQSAAAVIP